MKAKDVVEGMEAVLIEDFLDQDGFRKGDVVRVRFPGAMNRLAVNKEMLLQQESKLGEGNGLVYVYNKAGDPRLCYTRRLDLALQMELF